MTTAQRIHRKSKTRTSGFEWSLVEVLLGRSLDLLEAEDALAKNPKDVTALTSARSHYRRIMAPVADALGIDADSPLLVEEAAFHLATGTLVVQARQRRRTAPCSGVPRG